MQRKFRTPEEFWACVTKEDGCWEHSGTRTPFGHVHFYWNGHHRYAHRIAWEYTYGPIPEGIDVCHRCDNPPCVRPDHLFLGTRRQNMHDMIAKGRDRHEGFVGTAHPAAKLSDDDIRAIRAAVGVPRRILARQYGVTPENISSIVLGKTWRNVI